MVSRSSPNPKKSIFLICGRLWDFAGFLRAFCGEFQAGKTHKGTNSAISRTYRSLSSFRRLHKKSNDIWAKQVKDENYQEIHGE